MIAEGKKKKAEGRSSSSRSSSKKNQVKSDKKQFYYFAFPTIPQQTNPEENHLCVYMLCMFVYLQKSQAHSLNIFEFH